MKKILSVSVLFLLTAGIVAQAQTKKMEFFRIGAVEKRIGISSVDSVNFVVDYDGEAVQLFSNGSVIKKISTAKIDSIIFKDYGVDENDFDNYIHESLSNEWMYNGEKTPIIDVSTETRGDSIYFYLNKNVPVDYESQYGVNGHVRLVFPVSSLGTKIICGARTKWTFDLIDEEKGIEIKSNFGKVGSSVGGSLKIEKDGENYIINGELYYSDGKTLAINYEGIVTDLAAYHNSVFTGAGNLKLRFTGAGQPTEPDFNENRPITQAIYKFINFNEGAMYSIFLYAGDKSIEQMITDWDLLTDQSWQRASIFNNELRFNGIMIFIPASFVAEGRTVELSQHTKFADLTEHRLPWGITGELGRNALSNGSFFEAVFYGYEDKMKLGAATLGYEITGTMKITKNGNNWNIVLDNIARDTDESRDKIFSGEFNGTMESWTEYGKGAPRIWLEEWISFGPNAD
ncbi:MAG: hypothetical protein LBH32_07995 [Dysgonamonadaceae bacterium]|jgi:hypothetical protein|nr:hypothetical protein [Dysgonamonadaceae bacterium]